mgnify:CR=1 FL=1
MNKQENIQQENTQQENTQQENTQQEQTTVQLVLSQDAKDRIAEIERQYNESMERENI